MFGDAAGGAQARYAYDGAGRLSPVWDAKGNTLAAYTHTAAGNIATHVVGATHTMGATRIVGHGAGGGIVTGTYAYNAREWVTGIDYPGKFTVTQQYDAAGNVSSQTLPPRRDRNGLRPRSTPTTTSTGSPPSTWTTAPARGPTNTTATATSPG